MIEIGCLACSKIIKMPQYIDTEKYDGQVVCEECNSLLYIKLVKGKVENITSKGSPRGALAPLFFVSPSLPQP